jgi:WD40 repeat protein
MVGNSESERRESKIRMVRQNIYPDSLHSHTPGGSLRPRAPWLRLALFLLLIVVPALLLASCGSSATRASRLRQVAILGHGRLEDMAWSPNDDMLAVAGSVGVYLFSPDNLNAPPRPFLQGMNVGGWIQSVAFSPDGSLVAIGNNNGNIHLREMESGKDRTVLKGHKGWISHMAFSPDGTQLASVSGFVNDKTVRLWNTATGEELAVIENDLWPPQSVAFSPDGEVVAFGTADGSINLWQVASGPGDIEVLESQRGGVYSLAYSPDGSILAAGANDGTIRLWEVASGTMQTMLEGHQKMVRDLAFRADGEMLASASHDGSVRVWQVSTGQEQQVYQSRGDVVQGVAWSPDGTRLAMGSQDGSVQIWHVASETEQAFLPSDLAYQVRFSPDGTLLASGSENHIYLWDVATHTKTRIISDTGKIVGLDFSPDGTLLASNGPENTVRLWDVQTGEEEAVLTGHTAPVAHVTFSPDGTLLASASNDRTVRLWSVATGEEQAVLEGHRLPVKEVVFSPDGLLLASASSDGGKGGVVLLWEVTPAEGKDVLQGINVVTFNPAGSLLVSGGGDGTVRLWRIDKDEKKLSIFQGHRGVLTALAFNEKGNILATGSNADFGIILWSTDPGGDVRSENKVTTLYAHTSSVWSLDFGPDASLASASFDGSVRLWKPIER